MTRRDGWLVLGVVAVMTCAGSVHGQAGGGASGGGSIAPPQWTPPATEPTREVAPAGSGSSGGGSGGATTLPTAESVLQGLLNERSREAARGPQRNEGTGEGAATRPSESDLTMEGALVREGQLLNNRVGRVDKGENGEPVFVFNGGTPALPPMPIVPSRRRWAVEEAVAGGAKDVRVDVAEVTQYRGKNYLYIKKDDTPPPPTPTERVPVAEAVAPNEPAALRLREGVSVYNRVGRLVKDEKNGGMLFVFDGDGKEMYDPPMGVIPSRNLAVMESASQGGTRAVKFRVSGEITQYRGKNYLYPKVVQVVRDLNQGIGG